MAHRLFAPLALLVLPALAFGAPSAETLTMNADAQFGAAFGLTGAFHFTPPPQAALQAAAFNQSVVSVDLPSLLNRNLKAGLQANLGGKSVWLSGVFDRGTFDGGKNVFVDPTAFVSVSVEGEPGVRLYGVMDLLTSPQILTIGSGQFKLKLSPDITDQFASEIIVINLADNHKDRITLRDLLSAVGNAGASFSAGGQSLKVFYYDEVKNGGMDSSSRLFVFSSGDARVFTIPEGSVPSGKSASFQTLDGKSFSLQRVGDKLLISAQP